MRPRRDITALATLACVCALAAGCRGERTDEPPHEFFPSLVDSPKYLSQGHSKLYNDGRTMREPPLGVVAFGVTPELAYGGNPADRAAARASIALERADLLREDPAVYQGVKPDGSYVERIPVRELLGAPEGRPVDPEALRRLVEKGRERYNIYCIVCHGGVGDGQGAVGRVWSYALPSFHDAKYKPGGEKGQDGFIFYTIRNGVPNAPGQSPPLKMPSYSGQISVREAWGIVAYFRALQEARSASIESVPEAERRTLLQKRPPPTPTPAPAPATDGAGKGGAQ